jgi:ADP-heptose:LPS heptosyltransferase
MAAIIVQLARLGDLIQTLPAIAALSARRAGETLDLLCAAPLADIVTLFPGITRVVRWEADRWRGWAKGWTGTPVSAMSAAQAYLDNLIGPSYDTAYNLNQHARAVLAAHLSARKVIGPGHCGPLADELPPWGAYLRRVARERLPNHVHLADAFCGMCGVTPPGFIPTLSPSGGPLPDDLQAVGDRRYLWVAVIVGAGDVDRCVPPAIWARWITGLLDADSTGRIVLVGSAGERARAQAIQERLSPLLLGRLWDATGKTDLLQLARLLSRCQWTTGSDTGSLHLAAAVGSRALGLYFARARVHETGPYGDGHYVWQAATYAPEAWPINESLGLLLQPSRSPRTAGSDGWELWTGHVDQWGMSFSRPGQPDASITARQQVWHSCLAASERENSLAS